MAEENVPMVALYPTPPPFYKHFTKENLKRLRRLRKDAGASDFKLENENGINGTSGEIDLLPLPTEIRYLIPPEPPSDGRYTSFGADFNLNASPETLASQGLEQLYPSHPSAKLNPQSHLIALTRSLLTTFLSLIGILSKNPELFQGKVEDLQIIMYNIHELINEYRPHQARESLILLMEERIEKLRADTSKIAESKAHVAKLLQEVAERGRGIGDDEKGDLPVDGHTKRMHEPASVRKQRVAWQAIKNQMAADQ